jgi:hypothetical protein
MFSPNIHGSAEASPGDRRLWCCSELDDFLDGLKTGVFEDNSRRAEAEAELREYADERQ